MAATTGSDDEVTAADLYGMNSCGCHAATEIATLDEVKGHFSIAMRARLEKLDYSGDELVAACTSCGQAVDLVYIP